MLEPWRSEAHSPSDPEQVTSPLGFSASLSMKSEERLDNLNRPKILYFCLAYKFAISDSLLYFPLVCTRFLDYLKKMLLLFFS